MIKLIKLKKIDSTINFLKDNIKYFKNNYITQIITEYQTNSKCRGDNKNWVNYEDNIMTSFCINDKNLKMKNLFFNFLNVKIIINTIETLCLKEFNNSIKLNLKFPNDIFLENKKLGGILSENFFFESNKFYLFSFGLNLNNSGKEYSNLKEYLNVKNNIKIDLFLEYYHKELLKNIEKENDDLVNYYNSILLYKNKKIILNENQKNFEGIFKGINKNGIGILELNKNNIINITNGSIKLI